MSDHVCQTGWELRERLRYGAPPRGVLATPEAIEEYEALRREHDPVSVLLDEMRPRALRAFDAFLTERQPVPEFWKRP